VSWVQNENERNINSREKSDLAEYMKDGENG
jgi:hypothetical protein